MAPGAIPQQWRHEEGAYAQRQLKCLGLPEPAGRALGEIPDVNRSPLGDGAVPDEVGAERIGLAEPQPRRKASMPGDHRRSVALDEHDERVVGLAKTGGRPGDAGEDRPEIARRASIS
jgi:hypothetical protein